MIKINRKDGSTIKLDLDNEEQASELIKLMSEQSFQDKITAISLMKKYSRKHRCPNNNCRKVADLVCPTCGTIQDNGKFEYMGNQFSVIKPETFDNVCFEAERSILEPSGEVGGEKLILYAGEIQLTIMVYSQQPTSRITLRRIGKRRYNPLR